MKIDFRGRNLLESSKHKYNLSRKIKIGVITAALVVGIPGLMFLNKNNNKETDFGNPAPGPEYYHEVVQEDPIETTLDQINSLNIIINDNDCADAFITDIYEKLEEDGIQFKKAVKDKGVQENDAVVITLDQQYMAGPGVLVLAPYYNDNKGDSDALALALDTALYEKGFQTEGIECGIRGFREDENGNVMQRIPTSTEENNKITIDDGLFTLKGIIVGGQEQEMGWNYVAKATSPTFKYMIYDNSLSSTQQSIKTTGSDYAYTLVWDNWNQALSGGKQNVVYIALEYGHKCNIEEHLLKALYMLKHYKLLLMKN